MGGHSSGAANIEGACDEASPRPSGIPFSSPTWTALPAAQQASRTEQRSVGRVLVSRRLVTRYAGRRGTSPRPTSSSLCTAQPVSALADNGAGLARGSGRERHVVAALRDRRQV